MRFLLLLGGPEHFARWNALSEQATSEAHDAFGRFARAVQERGELIDGDALAPPDTARTVSDDRLTVTDGPFTESVEQLGGYYVIDMPDLESAVEVARLLPQVFDVEVRPTLGVTIH